MNTKVAQEQMYAKAIGQMSDSDLEKFIREEGGGQSKS